MRNVLNRLIKNWMYEDESVIFLAADIGGGLFSELKEWCPERVFNVGIAEQNMIGMAAGLSREGFRVICYSKACFISLRVLDQIKNALCYAGNPVILIASDAGYDEADAGYPHISLEDIGAISSLANIEIYIPTIAQSLERIFDKCKKSHLPSYIRINKKCVSEDVINMGDITDGFYYIRKSRERSRKLHVANGCVAGYVLENVAGDVAAYDDFNSDTGKVAAFIKNYEEITVWEEQFDNNGIYDLLCRIIVKYQLEKTRLRRIGPQKEYRKECFDREDAYRLALQQFEMGR